MPDLGWGMFNKAAYILRNLGEAMASDRPWLGPLVRVPLPVRQKRGGGDNYAGGCYGNASQDQLGQLGGGSTELSRSLKVMDHGRSTPATARNRSETICAGLWAPPRAFLAWCRPV